MLEAGVDIIEIKRVEAAIARHGRRFLDRVYTKLEQEQSAGSAQSLAARFAAKEAASKALGGGIGWLDVEVRSRSGGKPWLEFHGRARDAAAKMNLKQCSVSLSHSREYAVAVVVASD